MAVIQVYKCGFCKKSFAVLAEAEACEARHAHLKQFSEQIDQSINLQELIESFSVLLQEVSGARIVHFDRASFEGGYYGDYPEIAITCYLDKKPDNIQCKELAKFGPEVGTDNGRPYICFSFYARQCKNEALKRFFKERKKLTKEKQNAEYARNSFQQKVSWELEAELAKNQRYKDAVNEAAKIKDEIQKEVEGRLIQSTINHDALIENLDETWVDMQVIL